MVSLFLLLGCNLSYIVDLFAALHELASASARTLLKLASSVRALLKPYGDTLMSLAQLQRNIYQITSPPTCNLHAYRQTSELRLNSFYILTALFSFEKLIHLDFFIWRRVGWWRDGFSVASWLVAKLPGGETTGYRDKGSRQ